MQTPGATMVRVLHHLCKQELTDSVQWRCFDRGLINTARSIPALAEGRQGSGYRTYHGISSSDAPQVDGLAVYIVPHRDKSTLTRSRESALNH